MAATLSARWSAATLTRWDAPECPFPIEYAPAVLEEIRRAAMDAFFSVPHGGAEIGGVLFGTRDGGRVRILAARPLLCEHAHGPTFRLSEKDHQRFEELLHEGSRDLREAGLEPLGWYHSHTRSDLMLAPRDLELHERYFAEPWHIALVVRPHTLKPMRAGFFFREADRSIHAEKSYGEFLLQPAASSAGPPQVDEAPPVAEPPAVATRPPVAAPRPSVSGTTYLRLPAALLPPPRRVLPRRWLGWVLLAPALFLIAGFFVPVGHRPAAPPPSVSLLAFDLEGQLQIRWDRAAEPIRAASSGAIEVNDGAIKTVVPLDGPRLRSGSLSYARRTERVDVRIEVNQAGGKTLEEFTTFLGAPAAPTDHANVRKELKRLKRGIPKKGGTH